MTYSQVLHVMIVLDYKIIPELLMQPVEQKTLWFIVVSAHPNLKRVCGNLDVSIVTDVISRCHLKIIYEINSSCPRLDVDT